MVCWDTEYLAATVDGVARKGRGIPAEICMIRGTSGTFCSIKLAAVTCAVAGFSGLTRDC